LYVVASLRIALIAPPWFTVPPQGYGGVERVVSALAEGLVAKGHDVTLFAPAGSVTAAHLVSPCGDPRPAQLGDWMVEAVQVAAAYGRHREFDIIHDHTAVGPIVSSAVSTPVVHTVHGHVFPAAEALYRQIAPHLHYVCISHDQRSSMPPGACATVIYNGIDTARYAYEGGTSEGGDYLLFVGRMSPEKGILDAIEIARRSGRRLVVLAKVNEPCEQEYFNNLVRPQFAGLDVELFEQPPEEVKVRAYQGAAATLFPIHWREPFGLVMAESLSCGTPVIAYRRGSVPELVDDGRTGFVCDSIESAVAAVAKIPLISRRECRRRVESRFSTQEMVNLHDRLYRELLDGRSEHPAPELALEPQFQPELEPTFVAPGT
jgi:glycosyltransferase involved in cell wall biosynthesis